MARFKKLTTLLITFTLIFSFSVFCSQLGKTEPAKEDFKKEVTLTFWEELGNVKIADSYTIEDLEYYGNVIDTEKIKCQNNTCYSPLCKVNFEEAPDICDYAKKVARICEENFPKIKEELRNENISPPVEIIFKKDLPYAGQVEGSVIYLSSSWFKENPDDFGAIIHEMAHFFQQYPAPEPTWLVEGIADYIRYSLGFETPWSYPHCGPGSEHYTSGYWCSAVFLEYIERVYDPGIVTKLDRALREKNYKDSLFEVYTSKSLEELWEEAQKFECKETTEEGLWGFLEVDKSYAACAMTLLKHWGALEKEVQSYWYLIKEEEKDESKDDPSKFALALKQFGYSGYLYIGFSKNPPSKFPKNYLNEFLEDPEKQVKVFEDKYEALSYLKKLISSNIPAMVVCESSLTIGEDEVLDNNFILVFGYDKDNIYYFTLPGEKASASTSEFLESWELQPGSDWRSEFPGNYNIIFLAPSYFYF